MGEDFAILVNHKRTHLFALIFKDIQGGKGSECLLFITVLPLNVFSDFSILSLLTVPSCFSALPRETLGSWSYLSIRVEVSSQRLSLSSGVSRRRLYLGPTNGHVLILLGAIVPTQQVPWTVKYIPPLAPRHLSLGSWVFEAVHHSRWYWVSEDFGRHWWCRRLPRNSIGAGSTDGHSTLLPTF